MSLCYDHEAFCFVSLIRHGVYVDDDDDDAMVVKGHKRRRLKRYEEERGRGGHIR